MLLEFKTDISTIPIVIKHRCRYRNNKLFLNYHNTKDYQLINYSIVLSVLSMENVSVTSIEFILSEVLIYL